MLGPDLRSAKVGRLAPSALDRRPGPAGHDQAALLAARLPGVPCVRRLAGQPERRPDARPRPAGADRVLDMRGFERVQPPPEVGERGQPGRRISALGRAAQELGVRRARIRHVRDRTRVKTV